VTARPWAAKARLRIRLAVQVFGLRLFFAFHLQSPRRKNGLGPQVSDQALVVRLGLCLPKLPCCLTGRSSGQPPASHLARKALTVIIRLAGQAPYRRPPLNYHVRHHRTPVLAAP